MPASDNLLGEFLRARRELVGPQEHGLPDLGRRRVPGLRREEVAMLAGISAEYYVRLERGRDRHPSDQVLDALARVLHLDPESRTYLASLVTAAQQRTPTEVTEQVPVAVLAMVDALPGPAFVLSRFMDVLAANAVADRVHGGLPDNVVRHTFLDPEARRRYPDWEHVAAETAASLRGSVAAHQDDPRLVALVGELSVKSEDFRRLWARHDVRAKTSGTKRVRTPDAGEITLRWEALDVASAPGQLVVTYYAEPGTVSHRRLESIRLLMAGA